MEQQQIVAMLEIALACGDTNVIVRSAGAIAEIYNPLTVRQVAEWVTIGEVGGSHVHLKSTEVSALRYQESADANAALELLGSGGEVLCRISFRGTNPARVERFNCERADNVRAHFGHLADGAQA